MKLHLEKLRELVLENLDFETVCQKAQEYNDNHTCLVFSLESLHNLSNNGRVNPAVAKIAGLVGLRMVGYAEEGKLNPTDKCRGEKKALATIFANMKKKGYHGGKLLIDHCYNESAALALKDIVTAEYPNAQVALGLTGALCSFYAEKGGLMVSFEVN